MSERSKQAKRILDANCRVQYGIFGLVARTLCFPPQALLNEFLRVGYDPCDQDGRMDGWVPFSLDDLEYEDVKTWWIQHHPGASETDLSVSNWCEWTVTLIEREDIPL